jgi:hypothetical protein
MTANTGGGAGLFQRPGYYFRDAKPGVALKLFQIDP